MKRINVPIVIVIVMAITILNSCQKDMQAPQGWQENAQSGHGHLKQTKTYSSEVAFKWMDMELYLLRRNPVGGTPAVRHFAYNAIALYESVVRGMPGFNSLSGQLTDLPSMPKTDPGYEYYWPECANAAMASMARSFFPGVSAADKATIDSLESALNDEYLAESGNVVFQRSAEYGKAVAKIVFDWSITDGASSASPPYTPPNIPGTWVPIPSTAPAFGSAWGNNRLMVPNSLAGSAPEDPPAYSTVPSSDYYEMVKEVYDISQSLTSDQRALALYFRDSPGYGGLIIYQY